MINKYQTGGATSDQQAQIQQAIMQICQATGEQPETVVAALKNGKENFKKVLQALQQGDVQSAKQMIQQLAGTPIARFGAKLNYIRSLKGECPEGQEVKYFKQGGQMKCKCVDKAAGGEKVNGKKEIESFKKKKGCGGVKMIKAQPGTKMMQLAEANKARKKAEEDKKKKANTWGATSKIVGKDYQRGSGNDTSDQEKKDKSAKDYYSGKADHEMYTPKSPKPSKDGRSHSKRFALATVQKCGGKAKKHQFGGSLNGIPFQGVSNLLFNIGR